MARLARVVAPRYPYHVRQRASAGRDDVLVKVGPMRARVLEHWADWENYLLGSSAEELPAKMHLHEARGRPLGSRAFVEKLQALLARTLLPQKRGPKAKINKRPRRK